MENEIAIAEEMRRLAIALDDLASRVAPTGRARSRSHINAVRSLLAENRLRSNLLPECNFGDPAWDLLLQLYLAHLEDRAVCSTEVYEGAKLSQASGFRWVERLQAEALVQQRRPSKDRRRVELVLSPMGLARMKLFFDTLPDTEDDRSVGRAP